MKKHRRIKKIFFASAMLFLFLAIAYKAFFYFDHRSEEKEIAENIDVTRLSPAEMSRISEGDIILRRGFGFFSNFISKNLNDSVIDVTHAGIIVRRDNAFYVIHSLSSDVTNIDGVQIQTLDEFLKYSAPGKIIVTSAKNANVETHHKIAMLAEDYLAKKIPFDHNGNFDNCDELFCTELVWRILEKDLHCVKIPVEPSARKDFFFSMTPMYDPQYFDIRINQYLTQKQ